MTETHTHKAHWRIKPPNDWHIRFHTHSVSMCPKHSNEKRAKRATAPKTIHFDDDLCHSNAHRTASHTIINITRVLSQRLPQQQQQQTHHRHFTMIYYTSHTTQTIFCQVSLSMGKLISFTKEWDSFFDTSVLYFCQQMEIENENIGIVNEASKKASHHQLLVLGLTSNSNTIASKIWRFYQRSKG